MVFIQEKPPAATIPLAGKCCSNQETYFPVQQRFTPHIPQERLSPVAIIPLSIIHCAATLRIAPVLPA